jgi:ABC-type phosphate/phosphonate transport system substrate-binding protein
MMPQKGILTLATYRRRDGVFSKILSVAAVGTLSLSVLFCTAAADIGPNNLIPVTMTVGFTTAAFLQGNSNDVEAALKVLSESIGLRRGYRVKVTTRSFATADLFGKAIEANEINFAIFDSLAYVTEKHPADLVPVFIPITAGTRGRRYLVLVRRDSGLRSLDALKGKSIVELQAANPSVGHRWLQNLLLENGVGAGGNLFQTVEYVDRPSAAVLPVFFGRRDACLVDDQAFGLMEELNPQVRAQLEPIATSSPLIGAVICVSKANWSSLDFRSALIQELGDLQREPSGRQILNLFKIDQLMPFEASNLDAVRALAISDSNLSHVTRP